MAGSYIVAGARTPIGKMSGALASFSAADLGSIAIKAALERAGVSPNEVDHVIMGQVLMAGQGRRIALAAGVVVALLALVLFALGAGPLALGVGVVLYLAHPVGRMRWPFATPSSR